MSRRRTLGPWHYVGTAGEPAFQNSYGNYGAGYAGARYRKDADGLVTVSGLVANAFTFGVPSDIFFLPAGFQPYLVAGGTIFAQLATIGSIGMARVDVMANGEVILQQATGAAISWLNLDGISFYVN